MGMIFDIWCFSVYIPGIFIYSRNISIIEEYINILRIYILGMLLAVIWA